MQETLFQDWVTDFRKILFCIVVLALGTLFNVKEPKALAIALIVQGISNVDGFWDFLNDRRIFWALKIMIVISILFSAVGAVAGLYSLYGSEELFDLEKAENACRNIMLAIFGVAFPIVVLVSDFVFNVLKRKTNSLANMDGGEEDEI